jgi:tRNA C32,U32 (ribose-2'-O)-methylase TrmJ
VCLWELARGARSFEEGVGRGAARMETVERITESLLVCLLASGYVAARTERLAEEKLRRMVRRFALDEADAEVFLGMVRKMRESVEKMEKGK